MPAPDFSTTPLSALVSLAGERALVTGGGRGIGLAVGRRLAEAGASVMVADIDKGSAEAAAAEIGGATGATAIGAELDVTSSASVQEVVARAIAELGGIDVLVNNAGVFPVMPALAYPDELWDQVLGVNLRGAFLCSREAGAYMSQSGDGGVIVNVVSTEGFKAGAPGLSAYVASKHGLAGLTKSLAIELGQFGVRVLGVAPTITETPGLDALKPVFEAAGQGDVLEQAAAALPLGRVAVPDDVARVVLFCATDLAGLMTGSTLLVDAGAMVV